MLVWNLAHQKKLEEQIVNVDVLSKNTQKIGEKQFKSEHREQFLSKWIYRPAATQKYPPFGSAIEVKATNKDRRDRISE